MTAETGYLQNLIDSPPPQILLITKGKITVYLVTRHSNIMYPCFTGHMTSMGFFPKHNNLRLIVRKPQTTPNFYNTRDQGSSSVKTRRIREDQETVSD